ncbi:MAG: hypothetical protein HY821_06720 [Acidobacteria bacterium]|nr:hypothetical protein [Acidobacteriota bacterium]
MSFDEALQHYAALRQQRDYGQINDYDFRQAVAQLIAVDPQGAYWQLHPDTGQWMPHQPAAWAQPGPYGQPLQPPAAPLPPPYAQPPAAAPPQEGSSWGQIVWDILSVAGSAAMSAAWYWYSGMADTQPDKKTCIAMLVIPIALIVLRKPLDALLRPLEPFRSKIPPMVLAGCGVAVPFLVANYLYSRGESQFPFMFKTYVYSTILSYIILRTPSGGRVINPQTMVH